MRPYMRYAYGYLLSLATGLLGVLIALANERYGIRWVHLVGAGIVGVSIVSGAICSLLYFIGAVSERVKWAKRKWMTSSSKRGD
jgi:hypothetical protein